jgi:nucleoside-diphosphate-sugar epimerase
VRDFALTYPQLVRQAIAAEFDEQHLRELRKAFEAGQHHFDGLYRAGAQPFICHLVRTASIALAENQPLPLVQAALVHATYDAHRYEESTRPWPGRQLRKRLRRALGPDVEEIVWTFHALPWEQIGAPEAHLRELDRIPATARLAIVLHLANDLENHMDSALSYRVGRRFRERIESDASAVVQVARELGMPVLAEELSTVFREALEETLPPAVRWNRTRGYELPLRATSRTRGVRRFAGRVKRGLDWRVRQRLGRIARRGPDRPAQPAATHTPARGRERILVTGAGGEVGREIVPLLRENFALRLLDIRRLRASQDDEVVRADIRDAAALRRACRDITAIVHLAAASDREPDFTGRLMPVNVEGTYQVFEAARHAGVGRVVLASTAQVVGSYPVTEFVGTDAPVRPSSEYACTKAFGEALARYYAECHGVASICLRIGWFDRYDGRHSHRAEMRRIWCSPRDLTQLIVKSIRSDVRFAVLFAVSDNPRRNWDLEVARDTIGYVPEDNAPDRLAGDSS